MSIVNKVRARDGFVIVLLISFGIHGFGWQFAIDGLDVVVNDRGDGRMEDHRQRRHNDSRVKPVTFIDNPPHRRHGTIEEAKEEFCIFPNHKIEVSFRAEETREPQDNLATNGPKKYK